MTASAPASTTTAFPYDSMVNPATWLDINATQLTHNIRTLIRVAERPAMAAVKANGYGHGIDIAARAFLAGGSSYLAVARAAEGIMLRQLGFTCPILVIGGLGPQDMRDALLAGLEVFVWDKAHLDILRTLPTPSTPYAVHLKIDTGMGRLGCQPEHAIGVAEALRTIPTLTLKGIGTHFANADAPDQPDTPTQMARFDHVVAALRGAGHTPAIIHAANSAGTLYFSAARYDMVRVGITAYGQAPDNGLPMPDGVAPALSWHAALVNVQTIPAGHGVSYGSTFRAPHAMRVGVISVGYADGFRRINGVNSILLQGMECPVLGRVCMDHAIIDLSATPAATIGDRVTILGKDRDAEITAQTLATRWNTITYDVYTGIAARVSRKVVTA